MQPHESTPELPGDCIDQPSVAIIGSRGRMGRMLMQRLDQAGYAVRGIDAGATPERIRSALEASRIVLLCVPVGALRACLKDLLPYMRPEHLLMDVTSVKSLPMRWMEELFNGPVIGTHPMFGPEPLAEDMRVALIRGNNASGRHCREAEKLFERFGCRVFWTGTAEHDAGVALSQSLNFTVSAAFLATLARHQDIGAYLTPSFRRHLESARKHLTVDTAMFLEFSAMNPEFPAAQAKYREVLDEAANGGLARIAAEAAAWYGHEKE